MRRMTAALAFATLVGILLFDAPPTQANATWCGYIIHYYYSDPQCTNDVGSTLHSCDGSFLQSGQTGPYLIVSTGCCPGETSCCEYTTSDCM